MPDYAKKIVYLSEAQYQELITNQTITVNGTTINYDENIIYMTPQNTPLYPTDLAEWAKAPNKPTYTAQEVGALPASTVIPEVPVSDVQINGTSILNNGVASIPLASSSNTGVIHTNTTYGTYTGTLDNVPGTLAIARATFELIKQGTQSYRPITPSNQHESVFYGLAKIAGQDERPSEEPVGTYTPEAKGAIQSMLGISGLIAPEENNLVASKAYAVGDIFTAKGKLYKVTTAIAINGTIVLQNNGETISEANAEEIQIEGTFIKNTDIASSTKYGLVKVNTADSASIKPSGSTGNLVINPATANHIKIGTEQYRAIVPYSQHESTFYGLAKAAGDTTQSQSSNTIGTYTNDAKSAIRTMLGAVGAEDYATANTYGLVKVGTGLLIGSSGSLIINQASSSQIKGGNTTAALITPNTQHYSAFYGLAKAAGDTTQNVSDNAVGAYTDDAKTAIRSMLGAVGTTDYASTTAGVLKIYNTYSYGLYITNEGVLRITSATLDNTKQGTALYMPLTPSVQHGAAFYGLAKAAGDTTQSASSNAVGTYTDEAKSAIQTMLGIDLSSIASQVEIPLVETLDGTAVTITGQPNTRYVCGEVTSISITPPQVGSIDVIFTSGSTVAVLTLPSTVKMPDWFTSTLATNTIYEILITDGVYGSVMTWQA